MKKQLLIFITLCVSVIGYAQSVGDIFIDNFITYEITSLTPDTVEAIDYDMAGGTVVNIPASVPNSSTNFDVTSIGHQSFEINNLSSVTIGNNVVTIGIGAFRNNQISTIIFPASVTTIGAIAFFNNPLVSVTSEAVLPPAITTGVNIDTFNNDRSTIHLHIPPGTTGAYVTDAGALWTGFNPVTEDALSIDEFELANQVTVIATPNELQVISSGSTLLNNYILYTIYGAKVATGTESEITTSSFANGIYILKLEFDKGTVVKKVAIN